MPTSTVLKHSVDSTSAIPTDQWVHVAVVRQSKGNFSNSKTTLFIDGQKQFEATQPSSASQGVQDITGNSLIIGHDGVNDSFVGNVDNFLINNYAEYKDGVTFTPSNTTPAP